MGSIVGDVAGRDETWSQRLWVFHTVPQAEELGTETWGNESWRWMGNTNVWTNASCDAELNLVYLPTSAPSHHFYGDERSGDSAVERTGRARPSIQGLVGSLSRPDVFLPSSDYQLYILRATVF